MGKTQIDWTDETLNVVTGCTPQSAGCANCYAKGDAHRMHNHPNSKTAHKYRNGFNVTLHPDGLQEPYHMRKPRKVFINSMSDTFHADVPLEYIQSIFRMVGENPRITFQILTKRAERLAELSDKLPWPKNLWIGVTIERADYLFRLDLLRSVPGHIRFVSFEPLLGPIPNINFDGIHWTIVGGETGSNARPMPLQWARDIREQCVRAGMPFFFKQVGGRGRDKGGKLLDGKEWREFPEEQNSEATTPSLFSLSA